MARPPHPSTPVHVTITGTPKLGEYLDDLVAEEGYGNSRAEVARTLVWRGIEDLITRRILDRRPTTGKSRRSARARMLAPASAGKGKS